MHSKCVTDVEYLLNSDSAVENVTCYDT